MRIFSRISLGLAGAAVIVSSAVVPASADTTATTTEVTGGTVSIATPNDTNLAFTVAPGGSHQLPLTDVTVTDNRAGTTPWVASVTIDGFQTVGATPTAVDGFTLGYATAAPSLVTGQATLGGVVDLASVSATATTPVQSPTAVTGNNVVNWDANVTVTAPAQAIKGSYATTLTHSVL